MFTSTELLNSAIFLALGGASGAYAMSRSYKRKKRTISDNRVRTTKVSSETVTLWLIGSDGIDLHEVTIHSEVPQIFSYNGRVFVRTKQRVDASWEFAEQEEERVTVQ